MFSSKTILLTLFVGALVASVYAHDPWECKHGHEELSEPELLDIDEDWNPDGNDHTGRTLASYNNLRTYGYYGLLNSASSSMRSYVQDKLIPPLMDYFASALKVKYPVSGAFKVSTSSVCGFSTPSVLRSGVNADYVYFVSIDSSGSYVASSTTCSLASGSRRPLVGHTVISTQFMGATSDVMLHERNMICIMHEIVHTLGFSNSLYSHWLNSNGKTLTGHILSASLDGYTTKVINAEPLTSKLRSYFGCSSLKGAYMENTGSSGTAGTHFERRQYAYEIMTSGLVYQMQMSELTLSLLESTGWYVPDYSYADQYTFGQGQGCNFLTGACSSSSFPEYCSSSARSCVATGMGGGNCATDTRSDNCRWIHPNVNYNCDNPNADSYARLPSLQTYGRGTGSKCFEGTLNSRSAGSQTTFCFKYSCSGSGSSAKLTLNVGGKSVVCSRKGGVSVSGYAGVINCPDPVEYCATLGQKICPRGCMGRGSCNDGICSCDSGYKGQDCALKA